MKPWKSGKVTISLGNSKLGNIPSFSLPAGDTCPGKTSACGRCYAAKLERIYRSVAASYAKNLEAWKDGTMAPAIREYLYSALPQLFRIHVSGDFFSVRYIREWYKIIKDNPQTTFFAYTRSHAIPKLNKELQKLEKLPNFVLCRSWDALMPEPEGFSAHMGESKGVCCPGYSHDKACDTCGICFNPKRKEDNLKIYFPIH